jgi:hypothetical protein
LPSLKLEDYSDVELLGLMRDLTDSDGLVTAAAIAESLGSAGKELQHASRNVSIRLSWLKRYGVVDTDTMEVEGRKVGAWRLTGEGEMLVTGKLAARQREQLEQMSEQNLLALARTFGTRFVRANGTAAKMMEREMRYSVATRKRVTVPPAAQRATSNGRRRKQA